MGSFSVGSLIGILIGAAITGIIAALQRRHDRSVRLNEARIKAYGDMLGDSRMMGDLMLHLNKYELERGALESEIESRYLAWDRSGQRAMLLCTKRVHVALVEHRKAVFDQAEAMRERRLGELNTLSNIESVKHQALFAEMRRELGVPWDDSAGRLSSFRKRPGWPMKGK